MIKVVKRCEFPMPDGFKCNKPFKVSSSRTGRKYCDEHTGNDKRDASSYSENTLVNSTNVHAQAGNDIAMREWVMTKMKAEAREYSRIDKLEKEIERLDKKIIRTEGNSKKITSVVKKELTSATVTNIIEGKVTKALRRMNERLNKLEIEKEEE